MIRNVVLITFASMLIAVGGLVGVVRVFAADVQLPAALNPETCEFPCWRSIEPGETSLTDATNILRMDRTRHVGLTHTDLPSYGYPVERVCWQIVEADSMWDACMLGVGAERGVLTRYIEFYPPPNTIRLGDLLTRYGDPIISTLCLREDTFTPHAPRRIVIASLYLPNYVEFIAYNAAQPTAWQYDPNMWVVSIRLHRISGILPWRFDAREWRGLIHDPRQIGCR